MSNSISLVPVNGGDGVDDDLGFLANTKKADINIPTDGAETGIDIEIKNIESMNTQPNLVINDINTQPSAPSSNSNPISLTDSFQVVNDIPDITAASSNPSNDNISLNTINIPSIPSVPSVPTVSNTNSNTNQSTGIASSFFGGGSSNSTQNSEEAPKSAKDIMREKMFFLNKFERLREKGIQTSRHFDSTSNLDDMKMEYERMKSQRDAANSIKFQRRMMMMFVTGAEYLNNKFDPFDVDLDGWSESVHENLEDYDDIFEDLYEKYKDRAKMAPELRLMFALGGSAFMFHITNRMFKSSMPGMSDIRRQNPELAQQMEGNQQRQRQAPSMPMGGFPGMPGLSNLMGLFGGGGGGGRSGGNSESNSVQEEMKNFAGTRPEMKGPADMDEILASIERQNATQKPRNPGNMSVVSDNPSVSKRNLNISLA